MEICAYVLQLIGPDLTAIGANSFRELIAQSERVCLFSVSGRRVAIPYSVREGIGGYISNTSDVEDEEYEEWQTIYSFAGIPEAKNFDELDKIIDKLPDNNEDIVRFIGASLREKFTNIPSAE